MFPITAACLYFETLNFSSCVLHTPPIFYYGINESSEQQVYKSGNSSPCSVVKQTKHLNTAFFLIWTLRACVKLIYFPFCCKSCARRLDNLSAQCHCHFFIRRYNERVPLVYLMVITRRIAHRMERQALSQTMFQPTG